MAAQKRADRAECGGKPAKGSKAHKTDKPGKPVDGPEGYEVAKKFKGYNLEELGLPREAWPFKGKAYKGKHSYTINYGYAAANLKHVERVKDLPINACKTSPSAEKPRHWKCFASSRRTT